MTSWLFAFEMDGCRLDDSGDGLPASLNVVSKTVIKNHNVRRDFSNFEYKHHPPAFFARYRNLSGVFFIFQDFCDWKIMGYPKDMFLKVTCLEHETHRILLYDFSTQWIRNRRPACRMSLEIFSLRFNVNLNFLCRSWGINIFFSWVSTSFLLLIRQR